MDEVEKKEALRAANRAAHAAKQEANNAVRAQERLARKDANRKAYAAERAAQATGRAERAAARRLENRAAHKADCSKVENARKIDKLNAMH